MTFEEIIVSGIISWVIIALVVFLYPKDDEWTAYDVEKAKSLNQEKETGRT